jgi:hypothetical protein
MGTRSPVGETGPIKYTTMGIICSAIKIIVLKEGF